MLGGRGLFYGGAAVLAMLLTLPLLFVGRRG
jgi:hypothetical protein